MSCYHQRDHCNPETVPSVLRKDRGGGQDGPTNTHPNSITSGSSLCGSTKEFEEPQYLSTVAIQCKSIFHYAEVLRHMKLRSLKLLI